MQALSNTADHLVSSLWSLGDPRMEACGVGGSLGAQLTADEYSDIDLFLLIRSGELSGFLRALPDLCASLGVVLLTRGPIFAENYGHSFSVLYAPVLCCQFNVNDRATLNVSHTRKFTRVIFDRTGFLTEFTKEQAQIVESPPAVFRQAQATFWFRALSVWRCVARQDLWAALRFLADARQQLFAVRRLNRQSPPRDYFYVEKRLEADLGIDTCLDLAETLPTYDSHAIIASLRRLAELFDREAASCAATVGEMYADEAAANIRKIIR